MPRNDDTDTDLRRYLQGLRRRKVLIVLVILVLVNGALVFSLLQKRLYEGEAKVLLSPQMFGERTGFQLDAALAAQTEIEVIESEPVRALVARQLGTVSKVSADRVGQTLLIAVKSRSSSARRAATVTNAYARAYIQFRGDLATSAGAAGGSATNTPAPEPTASLVSLAGVPHSPVQPKPVRNGLLAGVLGVLVGVGLASFLEAIDDSVKSKAELRKASDLPVLGVIPDMPQWDADSVLAEEGAPPAAEAFRALRTSVQMVRVDRPIQTLQVASPGSGDGKTTVVANLGAVLARMGQRIVVLDADLRRPHLHEVFGVSNDVGVTSVLAGEVPLVAALQPLPQDENFVLLASGPSPPAPSELLASKKMAEMIFKLNSEFDVVVIDSPPILAVTDAMVLTTWVDSTIVIVSAERTRRKELQSALELLRQGDAPVVGTVLNRATAMDTGAGYGSYYSYVGATSRFRSRPTPPPKEVSPVATTASTTPPPPAEEPDGRDEPERVFAEDNPGEERQSRQI